jgi:hypothetical protein
VVGANLLQAAGLICLAEGIAKFYGQPRDRAKYLISALVALGLLYFRYVRASGLMTF